MKRFLKRGLALCLAAALCIPSVFASDALGSDRVGRTVPLSAGAEVTANSLWSATYSDLRTEHYITYSPNAAVTPVVWHGSTMTNTTTLSAAAAQLEAQGLRVVAGINGGFFNTDGTNVGLLMSGGVIRSMDAHNYYMVGFRADGTLFVDSSQVSKTVSWYDLFGQPVSLDVTAINASRANGGLYLFNGDFGTSMKNTLGGVDVVLQPMTSQPLTMNSSLTFRVTEVRDSTMDGAAPNSSIPAGCYVLSANLNYDGAILDTLRTLPVGTQLTLSIPGASSEWDSALYGISGLYQLVENGQAVSPLPSGAAPRTAIGIKADGTAVFYTIDGRQSGYSVGASYTQVAQRLIELGCVSAVALDGGGSTTLGATLPGFTSFSVLNSPSGGDERAVSNCVFLVTPAASTGTVAGIYARAAHSVVLTGGQTAVDARLYDTGGYPLSLFTGMSWTSDGGTFTTDGSGTLLFLAGNTPGTFDLTASAGSLSGSAPVRVVDALSSLTITRRDVDLTVDELLVEPGEMVELDGEGLWYTIPVGMTDEDIVWTAQGPIGEISADGLFTAGAENGTGVITASAGGKTVTISVKVDRGDPFTDIATHWSQPYVTRLYKLGLTTGTQLEDGSYIYQPAGNLTRGQLLVFITRMLDVDTSLYEDVELPFDDVDSIPVWMLPAVKAMYTLQVFSGSASGDKLYANVNDYVTREAAMTMLGRVLAQPLSCDLSQFKDGGSVSQWATFYVQSLVAYGIVGGSDGYLNPGRNITRGEIAKILTMVAELPHAELAPRAMEEEIVQSPVEGDAPAENDVTG